MKAQQIFETAFAIGGRLDKTLTRTVSAAQKALHGLQSTAVASSRDIGDVSGIIAARKALRPYTDTLQQAAARYQLLKSRMQEVKNPSASLTREFENAKQAAFNARRALDEQRIALSRLERQAGTAGKSMAELTAQQERLARAQKANAKLASLNSATERLSSAQEGARGMRDSGLGDVGGAAAMAAAVFAVPVKSAMDLENQRAELRKYSDASAEIMQVNQELAKSYAVTTSDMVALQTAAMQAAVLDSGDVDAVRQYTETAAKAIIALDMTGEQVGSSFSAIKNRIAGDMGETIKAFDLVNAISNQTAAGGKDVLEVLERTGGAVSALTSLNTRQVVALAGAFRAASSSTEVAATAQASFVNALMAGAGATNTQKEGFAALGVDAQKLAKTMTEGPEQAQAAIFELFERMRKLRAEDRSTVIGQIFGNDAGLKAAVATLLDQAELLQKPFQIAADEMAYLGSMTAEYESRAATTENQLILLKNTVSLLAGTLGSVFLPMVNAGAKALADLVAPFGRFIEGSTSGIDENARAILADGEAMNRLSAANAVKQIDQLTGGHRELILTIGKAVAGFIALRGAIGVTKILVGSVLSPVLGLAKGFVTVMKVMQGARMAMMGYTLAAGAGRAATLAFTVTQKAMAAAGVAWRAAITAGTAVMKIFNLVLRANPIGLVVTAIGALVAAGVYLYQNWDTVKERLAGLWSSFSEKFPRIAAVVTTVYEGVRWYVDKWIGVFKGLINFVSLIFQGKWSEAWTFVRESFAKAFDGLGDLAMKPINMVLGLLDKAKNAVSGFLSSAVSKITDNSLVRTISGFFSDDDSPQAAALQQAQQAGPAVQAVSYSLPETPAVNVPVTMDELPAVSPASVPALASGGIATAPTMAMIGEGTEPEAVMPLSRLGSMMDNTGSTNDVTVNFSPNITVQGGDGSTAQQIKAAVQQLIPDIRQQLENILTRRAQLGYA